MIKTDAFCVCKRCLREIESHEGFQPYITDEIDNDNVDAELTCNWCDEPFEYGEEIYIFC